MYSIYKCTHKFGIEFYWKLSQFTIPTDIIHRVIYLLLNADSRIYDRSVVTDTIIKVVSIFQKSYFEDT